MEKKKNLVMFKGTMFEWQSLVNLKPIKKENIQHINTFIFNGEVTVCAMYWEEANE